MLLGLPYEVWSEHPRYKGKLIVSSMGNVKRMGHYSMCDSVYGGGCRRYLKEKDRIPQCNGEYLFIEVNGKTEYIQRLVAETYIPNPNNLPEVNHKDENKFNNSISNLEWCDSKYNNNYGTIKQRISKALKGKYNTKTSKPVLQCSPNGETIKEYPSLREVERQLGFDTGSICKALKGVQKTAYGFIWKYK